LLSTPEAFGLSRIDQAVPFHFSTNVRGCNVGGNIVLSPTAKHSLSLTHETPVSSSRGWSEGCGGSSFQIAPVHRAAMTFGPPLSATPTAMHDVALVHDTPVYQFSNAPAGFGLRTIVQCAPSHCSARFW